MGKARLGSMITRNRCFSANVRHFYSVTYSLNHKGFIEFYIIFLSSSLLIKQDWFWRHFNNKIKLFFDLISCFINVVVESSHQSRNILESVFQSAFLCLPHTTRFRYLGLLGWLFFFLFYFSFNFTLYYENF